MNQKIGTIALALAACVAVTACQNMRPAPRDAAAGGMSADLDRAFRGMDTNGDGYISREEALADPAVARGFAEADANRDDRLDRSEFKVAPPTGYKAGN